jgi:aminopeptidase YwaD
MKSSVYCLISICISLIVTPIKAQDSVYARKVITDLCSVEMAGRGYVQNGQQKAAAYIQREFKQAGLRSFTADYKQSLGFQVISFPQPLFIAVDGIELKVGADVILSPGFSNMKGVFNLLWVDSAMLDNPAAFTAFEKTAFYKTFIVLGGVENQNVKNKDALSKIKSNGYRAKGLIYAEQNKLTASVSFDWDKIPTLYVLKGRLPKLSYQVKLDIYAEANNTEVSNLVGYVKGTTYPDSFIVVSAHYDHLGMMGVEALFAGANDNASGVAMMLDLMQTIAKKPLPYSVAFIAFAAEEIGLVGSAYYTEKPLFPLAQISLLINLDLMGTGDKGMTVVNATLFPEEFQTLQLINFTNNYLPVVNPRGKAANSDHYYFSEKGVKAIFCYLMGNYDYYHDVNDTSEALTLSRYNEAFMLLHAFMLEYSTKQ